MTKILIIPDIHGRTFWKQPVEDVISNKLQVDRIIFLGDYFDPYWNEGISEEDAIKNWFDLKDSVVNNLSPNKYVFLIGNHDAHYMSETFFNISGGTRFSKRNRHTIEGIFMDNLKLFQLAHEENVNGNKILFTHAGVNKEWLERNRDLFENFNAQSLRELTKTEKGWKALAEVGYSRGGYHMSGSPIWSDLREHLDSDNKPYTIEGYDYEVFGHTQQEKLPIICEEFAMLDCRQPFIMFYDQSMNEDITIEKYI